MCFLLFAVRVHPDYPLVIAANRDEFLTRPTAPAEFWTDSPNVLAGRDLEAGGTWLGMTRQGRFAALTNFRNPDGHDATRPSRGALVSDFLTDANKIPAANYLNAINDSDTTYNGYNLIAGAGATLVHYSNQASDMTLLSPGIHALSNALLDTPWPKSVRGTKTLEEILATPGTPDTEAMLALLTDRDPASDDSLPDTGVGTENERALSPIFIRHGTYGTRCSTIITVRDDGEVSFMERSYEKDALQYSDVTHTFDLID